jgi:hypothetical protein
MNVDKKNSATSQLRILEYTAGENSDLSISPYDIP